MAPPMDLYDVGVVGGFGTKEPRVNPTINDGATDGTKTTVGDLDYYKFTSSGDFVVSSAATDALVQVMLIGGGGQGVLKYYGTGSGAGGMFFDDVGVTAQTYSIVIGGSETDSTGFGKTAMKGAHGKGSSDSPTAGGCGCGNKNGGDVSDDYTVGQQSTSASGGFGYNGGGAEDTTEVANSGGGGGCGGNGTQGVFSSNPCSYSDWENNGNSCPGGSIANTIGAGGIGASDSFLEEILTNADCGETVFTTTPTHDITSNSGWTQVDGDGSNANITVGSDGKISAGSGTNANSSNGVEMGSAYVHKDLSSDLSDTAWTVDFDFKFIDGTNNVHAIPLALTTTSSRPISDQTHTSVEFQVYNNNNNTYTVRMISFNNDDSYETETNYGTTIAEGTTYYMRLQRTSTTGIKLAIYTNPARTTLLGTAITATISSGLQDLQYLLHCSTPSAGTSSTELQIWTVDNIKIWDANATGNRYIGGGGGACGNLGQLSEGGRGGHGGGGDSGLVNMDGGDDPQGTCAPAVDSTASCSCPISTELLQGPLTNTGGGAGASGRYCSTRASGGSGICVVVVGGEFN